MSSTPDPPEKSGRDGKATVLDVGRRAGVSGRTVSRVINGDALVRPETQQRILAAMKALDFQPNLAARSLRSARTFNICLLTGNFSSYYFAEVVRGAARACAAHGHHLQIEEYGLHKGESRDDLLGRLKVDGFILLPVMTDDAQLLDALERRGAAYVRVSPASDLDRSPAVFADDAKGVRELAGRLWSLGHRRFGYIGGPSTMWADRIRSQSFVEALLELGADRAAISEHRMSAAQIRTSFLERVSVTNANVGALAVDALMALPQPPTALFAFSDEVASGAIARAHQLGLSVPSDVAIAGFDDSDIGVMIDPPLTTIRQPIIEMMADAVGLLVGRHAPRSPVLHPVELIVRASTG